MIINKSNKSYKVKSKKKKHSMSRLIIPFVILSIFGFTGIAIYVQLFTSMELSPTLITCFYGFCTGELWMLASIKKTKVKNINVLSSDELGNEEEAEG